jgi:hypothetical protein
VQTGEGELHLGLDAGDPDDTTLRPVLGDVVQQGRLADSRLAAEHLHGTVSSADALEEAIE